MILIVDIGTPWQPFVFRDIPSLGSIYGEWVYVGRELDYNMMTLEWSKDNEWQQSFE